MRHVFLHEPARRSSSANVRFTYGDRHNDPGITHLTANAFVDNYTLQRTLIHEAAHGIGVTSDADAAALEEMCLGYTE